MSSEKDSFRYRNKTLQRISGCQKQMLKSADNYELMSEYREIMHSVYLEYYNDCNLAWEINRERRDNFYRDVDKIMLDNFRSWMNEVLNGNLVSIKTVYDMIEMHAFNGDDIILVQMEISVDKWVFVNIGPVKQLSHITSNRQSVHENVVEDATRKGISILVAFPIPKKQNTISEIEIAFKKLIVEPQLKKVIADIKDMESRISVVKKDENLYRKVLNGLWAKIRSYTDADVRRELVKRLYDECLDSLETCADGHVGRLVNVLCGFDDDFVPQMSKMEYFRNNIGLIAANDLASHELKVKHAKKLMDDVGMPEEERLAWFQAL